MRWVAALRENSEQPCAKQVKFTTVEFAQESVKKMVTLLLDAEVFATTGMEATERATATADQGLPLPGNRK